MIGVVVEGESDRAAATAVVAAAGHSVAHVRVSGGKTKLDPKIPKYHTAARRMPWVVFRDSDGQCPVELRDLLTAGISMLNTRFSLRIAHSMTEAWLLADRDGFARFFHVRLARIPTDPENLAHAKRSLLRLCAESSSRLMRRDVVTPDGQTGPLYVARINEFAENHWDAVAAAESSASLAKAIRAIRRLS